MTERFLVPYRNRYLKRLFGLFIHVSQFWPQLGTIVTKAFKAMSSWDKDIFTSAGAFLVKIKYDGSYMESLCHGDTVIG